jgi:hypothetical protein
MSEDIADDVRAFRLVRPDDVVHDDLTDKDRPKSSVFTDHPEDGAMSVFLEDEILAAGKKPEDLLSSWPGYKICYLTVGQLREYGQLIARAPADNFPGHANVTDSSGKRNGGRKTKLAKGAQWL